jgi:MEKHLA domain
LHLICTDPQILYWTQILLDSYCQLVGSELIDRDRSPTFQAEILYQASFVVVSHGIQVDPILNYGNQIALDLWEMDWASFTQTPSKSTAEPVNQAAREVMMSQVQRQGFIDNYQGVRISSSGRRFEIDRATIWNLTDLQGQFCGQAATFANWQYL